MGSGTPKARPAMKALFPLGNLCITRAALAAIKEEAGVDFPGPWILKLLERHMSGDWGDLDEHDQKENQFAIDKNLRILSAYILPVTEQKIWIISEADRSSTTILLPDEY
jgi:hypothetical protein